MWLREIPRYRPTYERMLAKRGPKVARIVLARLFLRSVYKMLRDGVAFHPGRAAPDSRKVNPVAEEAAKTKKTAKKQLVSR